MCLTNLVSSVFIKDYDNMCTYGLFNIIVNYDYNIIYLTLNKYCLFERLLLIIIANV